MMKSRLSNHNTSSAWPRAIIHMDMNCFFAAIEQNDFPRLRGRPIVITNGMTGTCIITSSYEARAHGIKTGMRLQEAYRLCPQLIQRSTRPKRYAEVSTYIMRILQDISPDTEISSVDEAFLDVTHCQASQGTPKQIGERIKHQIFTKTGLLCSIGISGDKTTSKFAAKLEKPNGFTIIPPSEAKARLHDIPVTALCGIAQGVGSFLADHDVIHCGDMEKLPINVLAQRFGNVGRRIWLMCQGSDPDKVHTDIKPPQSIGHGKIMPPNTQNPDVILTYLQHMSEKVAQRLRRHEMEAKSFSIGLRGQQGWIKKTYQTPFSINDGKQIFRLGRFFMEQYWQHDGVSQVQITALNPSPQRQQLDLFQPATDGTTRTNRVIDKVNHRYGEFALAPARLITRSTMPNVIAPAWRPHGHRQTI